MSALSSMSAPSAVAAGEAAQSSPEITVLVPVLDEEATVSELADRVRSVLDELGRSCEILFVDDGSRDATADRIRRIHADDPRVKLISFRRNFGKAAAISAGVEHSRGRIIITMDGDLQDLPEEIPRFLEKMEAEDLDLVSGWKRDRKDPASKRYPSKLFNWATRRLAEVELHDFNCGFKAYRREVLEQVAIYGELHRYIPVLAGRRGFRIGELPVKHARRAHGVSKYGWDRLYKGLLDFLTVLFITTYLRRPLHLFGVIGLVSLGCGFAINLYLAVLWAFFDQLLSYRPLLFLGILLMLLGVQMLTTGLLAELITVRSFKRTESYSIRDLWL